MDVLHRWREQREDHKNHHNGKRGLSATGCNRDSGWRQGCKGHRARSGKALYTAVLG